jgi:hypothetical protein
MEAVLHLGPDGRAAFSEAFPMKTIKAIIVISTIILPISALAQTSKTSLSMSPDLRSLVINSETPVTQIMFSDGALDDFITQIGQIRAAITPEVPRTTLPSVSIIAAPVWHLGPNQNNNGLLLAIRHPGYGWIGMNLNPADAENLSRELHKQAQAQ